MSHSIGRAITGRLHSTRVPYFVYRVESPTISASCLRTTPVEPLDREALPKVRFTLVGTFANKALAVAVDKETQSQLIEAQLAC